MTNSQNSASTNLTAIVLHPNTEQALIEERKNILASKKNYFDFFPLYGIFEKGFSISKSDDLSKSSVTTLSANLLKTCFFSSYFSFEDFLFFKATLVFENEKKYFYIPFAVNKNAKDKTITSAFTTAQKINSTQIKKEIPFKNEISFKSFQTTELELTSNQYKIFKSKWIKTNPDEVL